MFPGYLECNSLLHRTETKIFWILSSKPTNHILVSRQIHVMHKNVALKAHRKSSKDDDVIDVLGDARGPHQVARGVSVQHEVVLGASGGLPVQQRRLNHLREEHTVGRADNQRAKGEEGTRVRRSG